MNLRKVEIMMISSTFVDQRGRCITSICGCRKKTQLDAMIVTELIDEIFFDSGMKEDYEVKHRPSQTCLELSFACSMVVVETVWLQA
jgi:hypothetical protein